MKWKRKNPRNFSYEKCKYWKHLNDASQMFRNYFFADTFIANCFRLGFSMLTVCFFDCNKSLIHVACDGCFWPSHMSKWSHRQSMSLRREMEPFIFVCMCLCACVCENHTRQSHQIFINCQWVGLMKLMLSSRFIECSRNLNGIFRYISLTVSVQQYIHALIARPQGQ